ncbi:MAG TPA: glycosyltransferase family 39 protein [Nitrolancea sp.]|nr:glycosyltransferase family 39 protein [Nitrolancea sp.]
MRRGAGLRAGEGTRFYLALAVITLVALWLRLWAIDFGVPMVTHPDEPNILNPALHMIRTHDFNPHWFIYPALIIYIEAGVVALVQALGHVVSLTAGQVVSAEYVGGRLIMAASGIATVPLVGLIARRMASRRRDLAGLVAAGILAVSYLHVKDSHYLKPDIPTAFFTALTLWFTLDALEHDRRRSWLLAAVATGLAAAAKYTGGAVGLVPAIALVLASGSWRGLLARWRLAALMAGTALLVFLAINPYVLLDLHTFLSPDIGIVYNSIHYSTGHPGAEGNDTWRWYLAYLWRHGIGPTLTPLVAAGFLAECWRLARGDRRALLLLVFPLLYYLDSSRYVVRFDRQLIPILPFLAIIGGRWLGWLPPLRWRPAWAVRAGVAALLLAAFAVPLVQAARLDAETAKPDLRYAARDWIRANLPAGVVIAREWYTPPVDELGDKDIYLRAVYEQSLAWYRQRGVQYLVVSEFMYGRYLTEPEQYPQEAAFYRALFARPALVHLTRGDRYSGPEIWVFRLDDVADLLPPGP